MSGLGRANDRSCLIVGPTDHGIETALRGKACKELTGDGLAFGCVPVGVFGGNGIDIGVIFHHPVESLQARFRYAFGQHTCDQCNLGLGTATRLASALATDFAASLPEFGVVIADLRDVKVLHTVLDAVVGMITGMRLSWARFSAGTTALWEAAMMASKSNFLAIASSICCAWSAAS